MASRKDNSPASFADVKTVLDLAVNKPGLRYILKAPNAAIRFKQRCNKYRNLVREMVSETLAGMPGTRAETVYDAIVIRQINESGQPDRRGTTLLFEHQDITGMLVDPETGKEIEIEGVTNVIKEI